METTERPPELKEPTMETDETLPYVERRQLELQKQAIKEEREDKYQIMQTEQYISTKMEEDKLIAAISVASIGYLFSFIPELDINFRSVLGLMSVAMFLMCINTIRKIFSKNGDYILHSGAREEEKLTETKGELNKLDKRKIVCLYAGITCLSLSVALKIFLALLCNILNKALELIPCTL